MFDNRCVHLVFLVPRMARRSVISWSTLSAYFLVYLASYQSLICSLIRTCPSCFGSCPSDRMTSVSAPEGIVRRANILFREWLLRRPFLFTGAMHVVRALTFPFSLSSPPPPQNYKSEWERSLFDCFGVHLRVLEFFGDGSARSPCGQ